MGFRDWYAERVLPRAIDVACGSAGFRLPRADTVADTHGTVLEIGFGSGHNLPHYPSTVDRLLAVDPSGRALEIATPRIERSPVSVELVGLDGQQIPIDDASVDCVVSTFTLCTIPDATRALGEVRRVLRPGGALHFLEHGLSPDPGVGRWQRRLDPLQRLVAGGCELSRDVPTLVRAAGFDVLELESAYLPGPGAGRPWTWVSRGRAG